MDIWKVNNTKSDRVSYNYQSNKNMRVSIHIKTLSKSWNVYTHQVKGKVHPCTGRGSVQAVWRIGGVEVSFYPSLTTALEGGEGSASRPDRSLPPRKTQYTLYRRLGGPQGQSGHVQKISPPPGFDLWTVQPVASHYTDYATRPNLHTSHPYKINKLKKISCTN